MRLKLIRVVILSFIILGYVGLCKYAYNFSNRIVKNYSYNKDNLKTSNNYVDLFQDNDIEDNDYLGFLNIPKIDVNRYLYRIDSKENTVDKNVQVIKESDMPDKDGGNFILAAHNGNSPIAYFHNLDKLDLGDEVMVSYKGIDYRYVVSNKYDVQKTGKVTIKRDKTKKTITMITCKGEDKQLVVIGYLK